MDNDKQRGELAELAFALRATEEGLHVSRPLGDSRRYDAITDHEGRLTRVQVKSTNHGGYRAGSWLLSCSCGGPSRRTRYSPDDVDYIAAHIPATGEWYIIPSNLLTSHNVTLGTAKFADYQEAWHLLKYDADQ